MQETHEKILKSIYKKEVETRQKNPAISRIYPSDLIKNAGEAAGFSFGCANLFSLLTKEMVNGKKVLDFGCGAGLEMVLIAKNFRPEKLIGIDLSPEMVKTANKIFQSQNISATAFCQNLNELEMQKFDLILSNAVIHLNPDKKIIFSRIKDLLSEDSTLLFADFMTSKSLPPILRHLWLESEGLFLFGGLESCGEYQDILYKNGFEEIETVAMQEFFPQEIILKLIQPRITQEVFHDLQKELAHIKFFVVILSVMKKAKTIEISTTCPLCKKKLSSRILPALNLQYHPIHSRLFFEKTFNSCTCQDCNHRFYPHPFQIHDMKARKMAFFFPRTMNIDKELFENKELKQYKTRLPHYEISCFDHFPSLYTFFIQ